MSEPEAPSAPPSDLLPSAPLPPRPAGTIAIVGRPNVGKSTLFNRLVGRRQAIVHDLPGVTRDRIFGRLELDAGHQVELVDTGGLVMGEDTIGLNEQVLIAVEESDLLVLVVDGRDGLLPADQEVWETLRRYGKPAVLAVNKGDTHEAADRLSEFYGLGLGEPMLISAEHGRGIGELVERIEEYIPEPPPGAEPVHAPTVAVIGRPNVGKSSLVNRLVGNERVLVSEIAGTTRDPIDTLLVHEGKPYLFVDTAGIRRRSQVSGVAEGLAVMMARRQVERCQIAVLVIDGAQGVTSGDLAIAGTAWEVGRAVVVAVNKWDLVTGEAREQFDLSWPRLEEILADPPRVNVSALSGRSVHKLFPAIDHALDGFELRLSTSDVNRLFEEATRRHRPPAERGRPWKMFYATQVATGPPTFMLFANRTLARQDTYRRYLTNALRAELGLPGVPIRLVIRKR
jgi:GTP-binding protein